jgi:hypothetical protein
MTDLEIYLHTPVTNLEIYSAIIREDLQFCSSQSMLRLELFKALTGTTECHRNAGIQRTEARYLDLY